MKKHIANSLLLLSVGILVISFMPQTIFINQNTKTDSDDSTYFKEVRAWHQKRMESLKAEEGWLNLAGLFWLNEGKNSFGRDKSNTLVFPKGVGLMGQFTLNNGAVSVDIDPQAQVVVNNEPITRLKLFPSEKNIVMKSQSLRWFVIKRGDKYGIRLRDLESDALKHFTDVDTYPIDRHWLVKAHLDPSTIGKTVNVTDVLGHTTPQISPGTLVFKIKGQTYRLDAVEEGEELFILFADETNRKETYGSGRFLYADKPDANGTVYLDFNKATNPPCAFTPFATCPLPPKQNKLSIAVTAGEKNYAEH